MEYEFKGNKHQIRALTVKEITEDVISIVKAQKISEANDISQHLSGKDKTDFLKEAWKSLPSSTDILESLDEWFRSIEGIKYIVQLASNPQIEFDLSEVGTIEPVIIHALGSIIESKEDDEGAETKAEAKSEAS
jgi:hypothetical protein